jgi:hypothetical protein
MAWNMTATLVEFCSCKALCPCWLGPDTQPDQGWCSGTLVYEIKQGTIDGVDVSGCKAAFTAEWPGNFFGGKGTARVYLDAKASEAQRRELEAVFSGKKGGLFEGLMGAVVSRWLPAKTAPIDIQRGESLSIRIGDFGKATLVPYKDQTGRTATVQGTAAQGAFQSASMELASSKGTRWSDPDLRKWEGDSGTIHSVRWSA